MPLVVTERLPTSNQSLSGIGGKDLFFMGGVKRCASLIWTIPPGSALKEIHSGLSGQDLHDTLRQESPV
jgi:hypothetical protein